MVRCLYSSKGETRRFYLFAKPSAMGRLASAVSGPQKAPIPAGAGKDAIGKPKGTQLKVSVTAAPLAGKATDHMVRFLAPLFGVAVADIEVVFGQENVNKQLRIRAPKKLPAVFASPGGD